MTNATILAALLTLPGAPGETSGTDFSADCYLGHWEGHESRLSLEQDAEAGFYVGTPGEALSRSGSVSLDAGARGRGDVTVTRPRVYRATQACELWGADGDVVSLEVGDLFTVATCDGEQTCETWVDGRLFWAGDGGCEGSELPAPPSEQTGWWVPAERGGVSGWVRGDEVGFVVEVRCVGPDEGADLRLARWHEPGL